MHRPNRARHAAPLTLASLALAACPVNEPPPAGPDARLRTPTRSFNTLYQATVQNGALWTKRNGDMWKRKGPVDFGLGARPIVGISMDDQYLVAIDADDKLNVQGRDDLDGVALNGICPAPRFYLNNECMGQSFNAIRDLVGCDAWSDRWGAPLWVGGPQKLPPNTRAWALSAVSPVQDEYYIDTAGQTQYIGNGNVTTVFALNEPANSKGWTQRITVLDPWLPVDYSYEVALPKDGRFLAKNLSASGSTLFVINLYGDMYTRLWDFDISGADNVFFPSDFDAGVPTGFTDGACTKASKNKVKLPIADWVQQPKIKAKPGETLRISSQISISKSGTKGCTDRTLRVAGARNGVLGYFEKPLDPNFTEWSFTHWDVGEVNELVFYTEEDRSNDTVLGLGPEEFYRFSLATSGVTLLVERFNTYLSPARLTITAGASTAVAELHYVDGLRQFPRARDLDGNPREMTGAIRVADDGTWNGGLAAATGLSVGWNRLTLEATSGALVLKRGGTTWTLKP